MKDTRFVSLSGGGYRAALYHAGVLRALHLAGFAPPDLARIGDHDPTPKVYVAAVSGGALPAMIWHAALQECPRLLADEDLLPERILLDLVARTPSFGGRLNWLIRSAWPSGSWPHFVEDWWGRVTNRFEEIHERMPEHGHAGAETTVYLIELVDFLSADLCLFDGTSLLLPRKGRIFQSDFLRYGADSVVEQVPWSIPKALAAATAFPVYFPGVRDKVTLGGSIRNVDLIDAGIADNQAQLPILELVLLLDQTSRAAAKWFLSSAGREPTIVSEGSSLSVSDLQFGVSREIATAVWGWLASRIRGPQGAEEGARLSLLDRVYRLTGDVAQGQFYEVMGRLADGLGIDWLGAKISTGPDGEELWCRTSRLPDPGSVARIPTAFTPMRREDAVAVMALGAQTASFPFLAGSDRTRLKDLYRSLLN